MVFRSGKQKRINVLIWSYLYSGRPPAPSTRERRSFRSQCAIIINPPQHHHQRSVTLPPFFARDPKAKVRNIKAGRQQTSSDLCLAAIYDQLDLVHRLRAHHLASATSFTKQNSKAPTPTQHLHGSIKHLYIYSGTSAGLSDLFESVFLGSKPPAQLIVC